MSKKKFFVLAASLVLLAGAASAQNTLRGDANGDVREGLAPPTEAVEVLFRGDLTPEFGIGCSNSPGTSGGPNDWAVGVTAVSAVAPFQILTAAYSVFTGLGAGTLDFVAWGSGAAPGAELGRTSGLPLTTGSYTVAVGPINVPSQQFYFGLNQPESNAGMRIGVDSSTGGGYSFIRAPGCSLPNWGTLTSIGFPGNWVMLAVVDDLVPVELQSYEIN